MDCRALDIRNGLLECNEILTVVYEHDDYLSCSRGNSMEVLSNRNESVHMRRTCEVVWSGDF